MRFEDWASEDLKDTPLCGGEVGSQPPRRTMISYTTLRKEAPHVPRKKRDKSKKLIRALHKPRRSSR
jgi:hypothetical protein